MLSGKLSGMTKLPAAVELGSRGGKARAQRLTKKQRQEIARKAGQARWQKGKGKGNESV
jgi:hypothetical protein